MIIKGKADAFKEVDTGSMVISIGHRCDICKRKADTVKVSDIRICPSCIYIMARAKVKSIREEKVRRVAKVAATVAKHVDNKTLGIIIGGLGRSRMGIKLLWRLISGKK